MSNIALYIALEEFIVDNDRSIYIKTYIAAYGTIRVNDLIE